MPDSKTKNKHSKRYRARALYALVTGAGFTAIGALLTAFPNNPPLGILFISIVILSILSLLYYSTINVLKIEEEEKEEDQKNQAEALEEATYKGMMRAFMDAGMIQPDSDDTTLKNPELIENEDQEVIRQDSEENESDANELSGSSSQ